MKVEVSARELKAALNLVAKVVPPKSSLPVLSNVLLEAKADRLLVAGTDLDVLAYKIINARVSEPGAFTVPVKTLLKFTPADGTVVLNADNRALRIGGANIVGIPADEFPKLPEGEGVIGVTLTPAQARQIVERVLPSVAEDDSRPALMYIHLSSTGDGILLADAVDGFRMSRLKLRVSERVQMDVLVPAKLWKVLGVALKQARELIVMGVGEKFFKIGLDGIVIVAQLGDGKFPDVDSLDAKPPVAGFRAVTPGFTKVIERAKEIAGASMIHLHVTEGMVSVRASAVEEGDYFEEAEVATLFEVKDFSFSINAGYMLDGLNAVCKAGEIDIAWSDEAAPLLFRAPGDLDFHYTVMPMHLTR